jgi:hypothetical protein
MKFCHPSLDRLTTHFAAVIRDDAVIAREAAEGGTHGMPHNFGVPPGIVTGTPTTPKVV